MRMAWIKRYGFYVLAVAWAVFLGVTTSLRAADDQLAEAAASIGNSLDGIKPDDPRAAWFREARYGMFIHWGLYAVPGGEWNGKTTGFSEYISWKVPILAADYAKIAGQFNPKEFDAEAWAQLAQDAGMKYIVITSKHHDGFAMFRSKVSDFNVVDATPWKRDPMKELQAACAKRGIKFCFYYSHSADWHEPDAGGYNTWDFKTEVGSRDFDAYLARKAIPQVKELLSNYGDIGYLWFDWPGPFMTPERAKRMAGAIHAAQPKTLINSRLGPKDASKYKDMKKVEWDVKAMGDNQVPPEVVPGVWETAATMNDSWGYHRAHKDKARSAEDICFSLVDVVSKGGNYLLNVGPDKDGVIPSPQQETLRKVGEWLKVNGEAVYGAGPTPFGAEFGSYVKDGKPDKSGKRPFKVSKEWRCTSKPASVGSGQAGKLYIHLFKWPTNGTFELAGVKSTIKQARFLVGTGGPLAVTQTNNTVRIALPAQPPQLSLATVLVLEQATTTSFLQDKETDPRLHADGPGWRLDKARISDPSLPRVLMIGDSILQGYMGAANNALKGKANVDFWVTPLWQSEHFSKVLADVLDQGPYDVIHMNIGLHGWIPGRIQPGTYEPLTRAFLDVIRKKLPRTKFIWASSTPTFNKENLKEFNSTINPVIVEHNKMASKIMAEYGIPVNDFYALLVDKSDLVRKDGVHWNPPAMKLLAEVAVKSIMRELENGLAISLAGDWELQIPGGTTVVWQADAPVKKIQLPGSLQSQGYGEDITLATKWVGGMAEKNWSADPAYADYVRPGAIKFPFWLQPEKHFIGAALYRRGFTVPAGWAGRRIVLSLERVHITSTLWLDGKLIGSCDSLSTAHRYDLGTLSTGPHELVIGVDNTPIKDIGENSHCVTDHTQTAWNGIVGAITVTASPWTWIENLQAYPDLPGKKVRVTWACGGKSPADAKMNLKVSAPNGRQYHATASAGAGEATITLGEEVAAWDEFTPNLYRLDAALAAPSGEVHAAGTTFGMVDYRIEGKHFIVNGRPTVFRGTLDCAMFPLTGYPSTEPEYWRHEFKQVKAHGLNHVRFHSWCPPEAAFQAADEAGVYLLVEHAWTNPEKVAPYLMSEAERVIKAYGNHPSFAMHAYGNEPKKTKKSLEWMENFVSHYREIDPRRYYSGATGWPQLKNSQYHSLMDGLRVYPWGAGLGSSINAREPGTTGHFGAKTRSENKPFIAHESGQWCVYPDFDEIAKYTGFLKARNFEIFRDRLAANHMADQARDFLKASGRLQVLCYKYEIEMLLRTPDIGGYQLLGLNDFPGQGTALVGVVNPFWETKPHTSAAEYRRFSGPSVPLAELKKLVFVKSETLQAKLKISHYGAAGLPGAIPAWKIVDREGCILAKGALPARDIPLGQSVLGDIAVPLEGLPAPCQVKLVVGIDQSAIENDWDLWVYPGTVPAPGVKGIVMTCDSREACERAAAGATVLLMPEGSRIAEPDGPKIVFGFSTIFWNTAWTHRQPPTTMGILCDPKHPLFSAFPTDGFSNYQWWYLCKLVTRPLSLQKQAPGLRPLVQVIDDWFTARRLGLVVEGRCGKGRIVISAIDLGMASEENPVATQFRASLLGYMGSDAFQPVQELTPEAIKGMVMEPSQSKPR